VAGEQSPIAPISATEVTLGCRIRQVRSWAEPSDQDPLPGTYYVRLSVTGMPEQDLGLPVKVRMSLTAQSGDTGADQGELAAPLTPVDEPGVAATDIPTPSASAEPLAAQGFVPEFSSRWVWTAGGGVLAAVAGLVGFSFPRRRVRRG
jgi:hypothetical protein